MKRKIPWTTIIVIAILVLFGIFLPFWLEYKSMSTGQTDRPPGRKHPIVDAKRTIYCPLCGEELSVPYWRREALKKAGPTPALFMEQLTQPSPFSMLERPAVQADSEVHD